MMIACSGYRGKKQSPLLAYVPPPLSIIPSFEKAALHEELTQFFGHTLLRNPRAFNGGILVAKGGNVIYENYQGFEDLPEKNHPLEAGSALHIASTSKTFTGIALLTLVQEQKIKLDDLIEKFIPGFPYPGVTVKMLLNHRSGIPNYLHFMDATSWNKSLKATNQDILHILLTEKPPRNAPPDRRFEYSNTNYLLLAILIEKISHLSFPAFLHSKFFKPLGMTNTYVYQPSDSSRSIPSYRYGGKKWAQDYLDNTYGDKNIYSTPRDLLKWDQALYTDQLISASLLKAAFTPYSFEKKGTHNYGLGWRLKLLPKGRKILYHFGRWHGNNSVFTRLTDEKVTIIILGNQFNRSIYSTAHHSYRFFGNYHQGADREEE